MTRWSFVLGVAAISVLACRGGSQRNSEPASPQMEVGLQARGPAQTGQETTPGNITMQKLYKSNHGTATEYREAWIAGDEITEHWGRVGTKGTIKTHFLDRTLSNEENLARVLRPSRDNGYSEVDLDHHHGLVVEYLIKGMGSPEDLRKRHAVEEQLNETLGWTGLGHVDGGSTGSGTMEVYCFVVDFEAALQVVRKDLAGTPLADYSRIYDDGAD